MRAPAREAGALRVASYNIQKSIGADFRRRPERALCVLEEIDPDIVALQEVDRRFGARRSSIPPELLGERWRAVDLGLEGAGLGWRGNALLVRPGFAAGRVRLLDLPALEPRGAVIAEIAGRGAALRVAATHLGLTPAHRLRQARAILEALGDTEAATVLMGDINEWREGAGAAALFAARLRPAPARPSFHAAAPVAPLDRIFLSPGLHLLRAGTHASAEARRASDHLPVWADIALGAQA